MRSTLLLLLLAFAHDLSTQNIGIGTDNPTPCKFEFHGVEGAGATAAIFGKEGYGISFQRNG